MSDPVTNVEIEDVLSSIRKLVSDEQRPVEKGVSAFEPAKDRLVLTPDFRVPESDESESEEAFVLGPDSAVEPEEALFESAAEDDPSALVEDTAQVDESSPEPQGVEEDLSEVEDKPTAAPLFQHVKPDPIVSEVEDDGTDAVSTGLASRIAQLEAAVARREDSWDPDGLDASDQNTPAELQSSVHDVWETVESEEAPVSVAPEETTLEAEEDFSDAHPDEDDDIESFVTEDDSKLDEEALRALVSELVRQELQGTLGARITRNVRKLVRREIHRVLDSKDFE